VDAGDPLGRSALHYAAAFGHADAINLLLNRGAAVDAADDVGRHALHSAVHSGELAAARALLDRGARADAAAGAGRMMPLNIAAYRGDLPMIRLLLDRGALKDVSPEARIVSLLHAAAQGHPGALDLLLERGGSQMVAHDGGSAVAFAVKQGQAGTAMTFARRGAEMPPATQLFEVQDAFCRLLQMLAADVREASSTRFNLQSLVVGAAGQMRRLQVAEGAHEQLLLRREEEHARRLQQLEEAHARRLLTMEEAHARRVGGGAGGAREAPAGALVG
jgi:ankyrin repeat protein